MCCPHCNGDGRIKVEPESARTLQAVEKLGKPTALEIHAALGEGHDISTTHNRLTRLVRRGLLKRHGIRPHKFSVVQV